MVLRRKFVAPVEAVKGGWRVNLDTEERNLLLRLMGELQALITGPDDNELIYDQAIYFGPYFEEP